MKKLTFLLVLLVVAFVNGHTQSGLIVKSGPQGLYLDHTVAPKEGLYAIGRLYNVNPKYIAAYNKFELNKGLSIDEVIQIPLTDTNFTQKGNKGVPVYYVPAANEGLMKVSNANRKVSLQQLRTWNKLSGDKFPEGSALIVGFLISKDMPANGLPTVAKQEPAKPIEQPVAKTEPVQSTVAKNTIPEKQETMKESPQVTSSVVTQPVTAVNEEAKKETISNIPKQNSSGNESGFFKPYFDLQVKQSPAKKNETVTAGIFKTVSGWQDAKYYLLIDGVPAGNIVRIINPVTNKTVYAKVLGEMNGIRQNQGLDIRISSATASALGVAESEKFTLNVNY